MRKEYLVPLEDVKRLTTAIIEALHEASEADENEHSGRTLEEVTLEYLEGSGNQAYYRYSTGSDDEQQVLAQLIASITDDLSDIFNL